MAEPSPTPWRVSHGYIILDADGVSIAHAVRCPDADIIADAVNGVEATRELQRKLLGWSMERDRLRDLVRRLADALDTFPAIEDHEIDLLREAREALGEAAP